jgi:hypothetical protein
MDEFWNEEELAAFFDLNPEGVPIDYVAVADGCGNVVSRTAHCTVNVKSAKGLRKNVFNFVDDIAKGISE